MDNIPDRKLNTDDDVALSIVKSILGDIQGRYGIDRIVLGGPDRKEERARGPCFDVRTMETVDIPGASRERSHQ